MIGLASDALECLAVGNDLAGQASGVVRLTWQGQVERARLVLGVAGAEAAHTIEVNGQPAALAPVHPGGQPCSAEEYFYLDIAPELLVQGDNLIEITDDALVADSWTAANVRLEVFGDVTVLPSGGADGTGIIGTSEAAVAASTLIVTFTNSYDGSSQEAMAQIPDGYDGGTPTPLLVAVHPRSGAMEWGIDEFGFAANGRGWLLISPQLHGSWTGDPQPDPPGIFAYASLESQYDTTGAVNYMVEHYNVKADQIYIAGYSMGGQGGVVTAAKFPHLFAAIFDNKGPTDMVAWYDEQVAYYGNPDHSRVVAMRRECHIEEAPQTPAENPFCYQRRSGLRFASNYIHVPISMTHSISDVLVPIHHSRDLRDAINSYGPDQPASLYEDTVFGPTCPDHYHCYEPSPVDVLNFLEPFTLNNNPTHVNITTDESKSYYWMNLVQTGGDHWSQVEVVYCPITATVTAMISDTEPLTVGFNLGSMPIVDIIEQPGMGLPETTYLVKGGGNNILHDYTSGYLTTTLDTTGQFVLTISAIEASLSANPAMVSGWQTPTSTITAVLADHLNNPVPDGTIVQFSSSEGTFPNASSTYTRTVTGGQVTTTLTLAPADDLAVITASAGSITVSTSVDVIHPAIDVLVTPNQMAVYSGQAVTYTYWITNAGDITLTGMTLVDDSGRVCEDVVLAVGEAHSCVQRSPVLSQTTTVTATVTGKDPLGNDVIGSDVTTVSVISPAIDLLITPNQAIVYNGQAVTYTYRITNTGDITLTHVTLVDDGGRVCEDITLAAQEARACVQRSPVLSQTTAVTATVTGKDPLGNDVINTDSTTVVVESRIHLPLVARNS